MNDTIEIKKVSPKDVFLHLLAILTLYGSATAFLVLIFQYVNIYFPDPISSDYYYLNSARGAIRWSISSLSVIFPVYILTSWFLNKSYLMEPEKRNLRIRKWLVYFTIFTASLIIIGDLVTLIYNLLGGELTMRFILKVLAVFFVSGAVFFYYFWDLKKYKIE
ncbi:MAG: DUF5671 domain-containing protein [Candidatus Azambacteria bacterium]|nr:DUF5671 domain-containing protein [Candidatus Azambacteria bacterium]